MVRVLRGGAPDRQRSLFTARAGAGDPRRVYSSHSSWSLELLAADRSRTPQANLLQPGPAGPPRRNRRLPEHQISPYEQRRRRFGYGLRFPGRRRAPARAGRWKPTERLHQGHRSDGEGSDIPDALGAPFSRLVSRKRRDVRPSVDCGSAADRPAEVSAVRSVSYVFQHIPGRE